MYLHGAFILVYYLVLMESLEISALFIPVYLRQYLIGYIYWVSFVTSLFLCCIQFGCLWDNFNQTLHTVSFSEIQSVAKERYLWGVSLFGLIYALSFYRSQNVLCWSKCFEPVQKFSASSKTFVPPQKPILLNANYLLVWHKMFVTGTICK